MVILSNAVDPNRKFLTFGGVSTYDYECCVDGTDTYGAPERVYDETEVDGRNGVLHFDMGRYANMDISYSMFFTKLEEFEDFKNRIMPLTGYQRLEDSHHPDEFRYAVITGGLDPEVGGEGNEYCSITLNFSAKPQRFLKTGEQYTTMSKSGSVYNPTGYSAKPEIIVYGYGSMTINDISMEITNHTHDYVIIDCDLMDCYIDDVNMNQFVAGEFPELYSGDNTVELADTIDHIDILPRWWRL